MRLPMWPNSFTYLNPSQSYLSHEHFRIFIRCHSTDIWHVLLFKIRNRMVLRTHTSQCMFFTRFLLFCTLPHTFLQYLLLCITFLFHKRVLSIFNELMLGAAQWCSGLLSHSKKVLGSLPGSGRFCDEFEGSPCVCVVFLQVLWLHSTVLKHADCGLG